MLFEYQYVNLRVIICQAIRMHPFGMYDLLLWQAGADDGDLRRRGACYASLFCRLTSIAAYSQAQSLLSTSDRNPQASPLVWSTIAFCRQSLIDPDAVEVVLRMNLSSTIPLVARPLVEPKLHAPYPDPFLQR